MTRVGMRYSKYKTPSELVFRALLGNDGTRNVRFEQAARVKFGHPTTHVDRHGGEQCFPRN